ncbi:MAG: PadR family transcriptional regulator [Candidatus Lokiarchaeota archaeon]|nr:PadR family transcriptional regulator [Candidatus Lokiarchaeota archaeon]
MTSKADKEYDRWSKEVKRGAVTLAILALLERETAYGYEVVKRLEDMTTFLALEQGTVYPLLRRLEKRDLLVSEWNYEDKTKPKKYYRITAEGKTSLNMMKKTWADLSQEMNTILFGVEK